MDARPSRVITLKIWQLQPATLESVEGRLEKLRQFEPAPPRRIRQFLLPRMLPKTVGPIKVLQ